MASSVENGLSRWFDELTHKYLEFRMQLLLHAAAYRSEFLFRVQPLDDQYAKFRLGTEELSADKLRQFSAVLAEAKKDWQELQKK
jgi:hypothetical protein